MKRRWGVKAWLLGALALVVAGVAFDASRVLFPSKEAQEQAARGPMAPEFKEGDPAPDFALPDRTGKERRLSELVRGDTLLMFTCGCANCQEVETYIGILRKKMGVKAPQVLNVTTAKPEGEESWMERTALPQTILYEAKEGPVMKQYRGHPCPRIYRVRPDRTVAWIGPSPSMNMPIQVVGRAVAHNLGFNPDTNQPAGSTSPTDPASSQQAPPAGQEPKPGERQAHGGHPTG